VVINYLKNAEGRWGGTVPDTSAPRLVAPVGPTHRCAHAPVDVTQLFSLRENAIAKEPGSS
jgi:hypothetical protein